MLVEGNLGIALVLIANLIGSMFPAPLVGSQTQLAKIQVDEWKVYYDRWSVARGTDKSCNEVNLYDDVGKYVDKTMQADALNDPYGSKIMLLCEDAGFKGIYSWGENKKDDKGAGDDVTSWGKLKE